MCHGYHPFSWGNIGSRRYNTAGETNTFFLFHVVTSLRISLVSPLAPCARPVCTPEHACHYGRGLYLRPTWRLPFAFAGASCAVVAAYDLARGSVRDSFNFTPAFTSEEYLNIAGTETGLLFNFLPSFIFALYNSTFLTSDTYHRLMQSVHGMSLGKGPEETLLVDYISPDPISGSYKALRSKHFRIFWGIFIANTWSFVVTIAGRIFSRQRVGLSFIVTLSRWNLYLSLAALVVGTIWMIKADLPLSYRCTRAFFRLTDVASFTYHSSIHLLPQFRVPAWSKNYEDLKRQVMHADGSYQFGLYLGLCGRRHLGFDLASQVELNGERLNRVDKLWSFTQYISLKDQMLGIQEDSRLQPEPIEMRPIRRDAEMRVAHETMDSDHLDSQSRESRLGSRVVFNNDDSREAFRVPRVPRRADTENEIGMWRDGTT